MDKITLATVAMSGSYNDLSNKPTVPTKFSELENDDGYIKKDVVGNVSLNEYICTDYQYLIAPAIKGSDGGIMLVNEDGSISTVDSYDDNKLDIKTSGDGTKFLADNGRYKEVYTKDEIDTTIGDINTILESIING
jgi:hypothetical protein